MIKENYIAYIRVLAKEFKGSPNSKHDETFQICPFYFVFIFLSGTMTILVDTAGYEGDTGENSIDEDRVDAEFENR